MSIPFSIIKNRTVFGNKPYESIEHYENYNKIIPKKFIKQFDVRIRKYGDKSYFNPYYWLPYYYDIIMTIMFDDNLHNLLKIIRNCYEEQHTFDDLIKKLEENNMYVRIEVHESSMYTDMLQYSGICMCHLNGYTYETTK